MASADELAVLELSETKKDMEPSNFCRDIHKLYLMFKWLSNYTINWVHSCLVWKATGQLAPLNFDPWSTHTFFFAP